MDTIGNVIDKLLTINLKTIHNLEKNNFKPLNDLLRQKNLLVNEINNLYSKKLNKNNIRLQHKTY